MKNWRKSAGIFLACFLLAGLLPVNVSASETTEENTVETTAEITVETTAVETVPETVSSSSGEWAIDDENFPDENFRAYLLATWDENRDGTLSLEEANRADRMDVSGLGITSLQGIECFRNLQKMDCSKNELTKLELSGMEQLQELRCHENNLTVLDLIRCPALETLYCSKNQLTSLCLGEAPCLTTLLCQDNRLAELDVSACPALEFLLCSGNCLPFLDVTASPKLTELQVQDNVSLRPELMEGGTLDLTTVPGFDPARASGWKNASAAGNILTVEEFASTVTFTYELGGGKTAVFTWVVPKPEGIPINPDNFPDDNFRLLVSLTLDTCKDRILTPDEIEAATILNADGWNIGSLKGIEHLTALRELHCGQNALPFLDVSGFDELTVLEAEDNTALLEVRLDQTLDITTIEGFDSRRASDWTGGRLRGNLLLIDENQVRFRYDVDGEAGEKSVQFTWTFLAAEPQALAVDEFSFPDEAFRVYLLENADRDGDGMLSNEELGAVTRLYLEDLGIISLKGVELLPNLRELYCGYNQLTTLDLSGCRNLVTVVCDSNGLTSLALPEGETLEVLSCGNNRLIALDVQNCLGLRWLFCGSNRLKNLDVSRNEKLEKLDCSDNALTEEISLEPPETVPEESAPREESAVECGLGGHHFAPWSPLVLPTCHSEGVLGHSTCTVCGKSFDVNGKELTDLSIPIAPDRHGSRENVPGTKATCTQDGVTDGVYCKDCGRYIAGHVVIPAAHSMSAWIRGTTATQTEPGTLGHFDCTVCGRHFDASGNELMDLIVSAGS